MSSKPAFAALPPYVVVVVVVVVAVHELERPRSFALSPRGSYSLSQDYVVPSACTSLPFDSQCSQCS